MKTNQLSFLFSCAFICIAMSCQKKTKPIQKTIPINYIDSLYQVANQLKTKSNIEEALQINSSALRLVHNNDSIYSKLIRQRIIIQGYLRPLDSVFYYTNQLLALSRKKKDLSLIADSHYLKAFYYNKDHQIDNTITNAYEAIELYKQANDSNNVASKSKFLVDILNSHANYEEAEQIAIEGLNYLNTSNNNKQELSNIYNYIAISTKNKGNYKEALYWYNKALNLTTNKLYQNTIENNKAVVYLKQNEYQKAFELLSEIKDDSILNIPKNSTNKARVLDNWAYAKSKLTHPDAEKYLLEALALRKEKNVASRLNASYIHLAEHYADRDDPKAIEMAENAYKTSKTYNNPDDQLKALSILIEVAKEPRKYALLYRDLSDSINTLRERAKTSYAKIKYDVEHNRQENKNLKAQALIQELEVSKAKFRVLVLFLLLVVILGGTYWMYRYIKNRHRKEKEKAAYDAELRISKKIHDEVANDAFNTLTLVQKQPLDTHIKKNLEDSIDNLYKKTRDIARNYSDIDVNQNFNESLVDLLSNYNSEVTRIISKGIKDILWKELDEIKKRALYRCIQELLINMKKHSEASLVVINFQQKDKYLFVSYSDNGIGLKKENLEEGNGIKNVENRINAIKGNISFDISSGTGCKILIKIPS